ncbi:MAG: histidine--tRNA ligase [Actinomycetales bacterium]
MSRERRGGLSGFPEWSPPQRWVELRLLDRLRETFELHGFAPLQTRSVEPLSQLLRKGETDKEIYVLSRLQADAEGDHGSDPDDRLGLHFDLTVPFARWVVENAGHLTFPFKRYQIQPVWRGERPQDGRFREFVQADIDVVGAGDLPAHHEVDVALVMAEALQRLDVGAVRVRVSHRRLAEGFLSGVGVTDTAAGLAALDKLDKIGPERVRDLLESGGATSAQAQACLDFASLRGPGAVDAALGLARRHGAVDDGITEGAERLAALVAVANDAVPGVVEADLSIARGLDYYTGTVYETELVGHESVGSVCSGGRYDDLASEGADRYPGVGLSIGVTRLLSRVFGAGVEASRRVPTCVLVAVDSDEDRHRSDAVARALRARGIPADTAPTAAKYGRQIRHADRLGIPFVWFPARPGDSDGDPAEPAEGAAAGMTGHEVKDIRSGDQSPADPNAWEPPAADRWPSVARPLSD